MIVAKETTKDWVFPIPDHIYFLSNNKLKLYAYINGVTGESKIFKNPIAFEPRYRTFEIIKRVDDEADGIPVKGSKGDVYYVKEEDNNYKCSCTGFKFHGTCKHIEKVKENKNG